MKFITLVIEATLGNLGTPYRGNRGNRGNRGSALRLAALAQDKPLKYKIRNPGLL
jgi:hypothetical protein